MRRASSSRLYSVNGPPAQAHVAGCGAHLAVEDIHQGALARAVGADHAGQLATPQGQLHPLQAPPVGLKLVAQAVGGQHVAGAGRW